MSNFDELYTVAFTAVRGDTLHVSSAVVILDSSKRDALDDLCAEELNKRYPVSDGFAYGYFSPPERVPEDYIMTVALSVIRKSED
jgi:hypothetical protein